MINKHDAILTQLLRAIALSEGEFALLLARCNSLEVRDRLMVKLRSQLGAGLLVWNATSETGAVNLVDCLEDAPDGTQAACITGLESSPQLNDILAIANNAREEFRKRLAFPVVLWVTDEVEMQLRRRSPDLASWAAPPFVFALDQSELHAILERETEDVLDWAFSPEGKPGVGLELQGAWQEWQQNGVTLSPELEARVVLAFGMEAGSDEAAREALERCLDLVETGALAAAAHYRLGLWWERWGKLNRVEFLSRCDRARKELQQSWDDPAGRHPNVGLALGGVLLALALPESQGSKRWQAVTAFAEQLDRLPAFACGLRAEVALAQQDYPTAKREAERALQANDRDRTGLYWLALGRSLVGMDRAQEAIAILERAKAAIVPEVDPDLHIRVLWALHGAYTAAKDYQRAFAAKCDRVAVETQYGFRAFIGAGRLRPQRRVGALGEAATEEIAASGRQADIDALVERVKRNDCRLTVVHGPSGVGKSSLIQAGLVPALRKLIHQSRSVVPVVIEHYEDWQGELAQKIQAAFPQHSLLTTSQNVEVSESQPDVSLATKMLAQLRENDRQNLITVLIFDQFEEFFFKHFDVSGRRQLYDFLRECLNTPYVWIFLSLREDYVHYLLECDRLADFKLINNDILNKNVRYYLGNFSQDRAKAVIQELLEKSPYRLDRALIDRWVADLAEDLGEVRPIEMQVVGAQMVDSDAKILTLADYQLLGERPKQRLVERWLAEVVEDCGQENEELAQRVLFALTEEPEKRPLKTKTELQRDVHLLMPSDSPEEQEQSVKGDIDYVLTVPIGSGLAFEIPASPEACYQLIHDYLVPPIRQQFGEKLTKQLEEERKKRKLAENERDNAIEKELQAKIEADKIKSESLEKELETNKKNNQSLQKYLLVVFLFAIIATGAGVLAFQQKRLADEYAEKTQIALDKLSVKAKETELALDNLKKEKILRDIADYSRNQELSKRRRAEKDAIKQKKLANKRAIDAQNATKQAIKQTKLAETKATEALNAKNAEEIQRKQAEAQKNIAKEQAKIARKAEAKAKNLAETNRLNALNTKAVADSLYWKGLMDAEQFNLEEQIATLEKAKEWQGKLKELKEDNRLELLTTLYRTSHIPREKNRFEDPQDKVNKIAFSPDGQTIFIGGRKAAKFWSRDGRLLQTISFDQPDATSVAISADGQTIVTGHENLGQVKLWSRNGGFLKTFPVNSTRRITSIAVSANGQTIVTGGDDGTVEIGSPDSQALQLFTEVFGRSTQVVVSGDGQTIVTGGDKPGQLWSHNGRLLQTFGETYAGRIAISDDGKTIVNGDLGSIQLWDIDGHLLQTVTGNFSYITSLAISHNGQNFLAGEDGAAQLWNRNGRLLQTFSPDLGFVTSVAFSPDEKTILTGTLGQVKLWSRNVPLFKNFLFSEPNFVNKIVISHDEQTILTIGDNGLKLWSINGQLLQSFPFKKDEAYYTEIAISRDGQTILTMRDNTVKLWNRNGRLFKSFPTKEQSNAVAISPDGKTILTIGSSEITLWSRDGHSFKTFPVNNIISQAAFSPDGKTILTGGNKQAEHWSLDGRLLRTFTPHQASLADVDPGLIHPFGMNDADIRVTFSPNGKTILTGSFDTIKLWNLNGRLLQTLPVEGTITSAAFTPDGQRILITRNSDVNNKVTVLDINIDHYFTVTCEHLLDFAKGSVTNPNLPEESRKLRDRARRACEGIPPPKTSTLSPQTKKTPNPLTWATQLLSQTFQSLIKRP